MGKNFLGGFLCFTILMCAVTALADEIGQQTIESQAAPAAVHPFRLALGIGIPYGGIGANAEMRLGRYFAATAGFGSMDGEPAASGGVRFYPLGHDRKVSPRVSAYYGSVTIIDWGIFSDRGRNSDEGMAYGAGLEWQNSTKYSLDFELLYVDYAVREGFTRTDEGDFKFVLGYGWRF
ncbi:MAG: hypothetical protein IT362_05545 [Deltaproteobacteria bacterium]|nr:hypothetical protein [Deltaproteobacteria bacterium]